MSRPLLSLLPVALALLVCVVSVRGERAIFDRYVINVGYTTGLDGRFVTEVSANLSARANAGAAIHAAAGSRLWKTTLFASGNADGSGNTRVFDEFSLGNQQASQSYVPGSLVKFKIPTTLDMDVELSGFRFLCLRSEKAPNANPDFEFVVGTDDFATLCVEINFSGVQLVTVEGQGPPPRGPDTIVSGTGERAIFDSYGIIVGYTSSQDGRFVTEVSANLSARANADAAIHAAAGSRLWKTTLFASDNADGSGNTRVFDEVSLSDQQASQSYIPGGLIKFQIPTMLNMDVELSDLGFLCLRTEKAPNANPDFEFVSGTDDFVKLCVGINFDLKRVKIEGPGPPPPGPDNIVFGPTQAIVESSMLDIEMRRSNPEVQIVDIDVTGTFVFDEASAAVAGGPWQLRVFVGENEDGTGRQADVSSQLLDDPQASLPVNPGDTIRFSGRESFDYSDLALGPGLDFEFICTELSKNSDNDDIELLYEGSNTVTQCKALPPLTPRPPAGPSKAIVESSMLDIEMRRTNPGVQIVDIDVTNTLVFDETSAAVAGGPWQLRVFVSESEDGTGRKADVSSQYLDDAQAYLPVNPGDTIRFSGRESFDFSDLALGPGLDFEYICAELSKNSDNDDIEIFYDGSNTVTQCKTLPPLSPRPPAGPSRAIVESQVLDIEMRRSNPEAEIVDIDVVNTLVFDETSAAVAGGPWQLRVFVGENEDGTGRQAEVSSQLLDDVQAYLSVNPGDTIRFSGSESFDFSELALGPGLDFEYLCTELSKDSDFDDIELFYDGRNTVTQCRALPPLSPRPPAAIVKSQTLELGFQRSNPASQVIDFDILNILVFDEASTTVGGGSPIWQLRVFVSGNGDGSGGQRDVASQLLDHAQSSINVNPGDTVRFSGSESFDFTGLAMGPGSDYPYICTTLSKSSEYDDIELLYKGSNTVTQCKELPALSPSPLILPPGPITERETQTCYLWGDPHTKTFDGYGYTHQGDSEYIAVTTCHNEDGSLPDFEVVIDNFRRRPSKPITYIRQHRLYYNGVVYALTHPNEASVDGVKVTFPYTDSENGVRIHYSPPHKILSTHFGLVIRFDNDHSSDITLPVSYQNKVCGLCGNFDGERSNECQFRNGTLMKQHNEECKISHTIEWIYETPGYPPAPPLIPEDFRAALRPCDEGTPLLEMAKRHCGILLDTSGPLAVCHAYVDPEIYFTSCTYDLCQLLPEVFFLCGSVESYVYDCSRMTDWQVDIGDWRTVTECDPKCTDGTEFNARGPACPPSCVNPDGSADGCPIPYLEVCHCPEADGTVLDGTKCVLPEECGCIVPMGLKGGRYLSIGEEFVNNDCSEQCSCVAKGDLRCTAMDCTEHAACSTKSGTRDCYCDDGFLGNGRSHCNTTGKFCHIYGDPHFHTFDEDSYSFQGDCTYTAVTTCKPLPAGVPQFRVMIHNDALIPEERFTYLTMVRLHFRGHTYRLRYTGEVSVNGNDVAKSLPYEDENVEITRSGKDIVLATSFGVMITYDRENNAAIEIPEDYFDKVCGLCGNADGDMTNDKQKPDGTLAKKKDFANSWGAGDCPTAETVQTCVPYTKDYEDAVDICSELVRADGPFAHCHGYKQPFIFFQSCTYDLCGTLPSTDLFCSSALQYLRACAEKGGGFNPDWQSTIKYCGSPDCTEGYTNYKQSCYRFVSEPANYEFAKSACEADGAHLASISSRAENEFISSLAESQRAWIGAIRDPSASFSTYTSEASGPYKFLPDRLSRGIGSFRFSVQAHSGAHILLSSTNVIDGETPLYEIVIGADRNKRNFLRRCQDCNPKAEQFKSYLNKRLPRDFFVNFHEGKIQVGDMTTRETLMEFRDPLPMRVRYIAFKTVGRTGSWTFYDTEYMWDTEEPWTYDNWRFGEPSNFHKQENCVETNFVQPGVWNDHFCKQEKSFVCEVDEY